MRRLAPTLARVVLAGCALPLLGGCAADPGTGGPSGSSAAEAEAQLRSLPYGDAVPVSEGDVREGVVIHERDRAWSGVNLFNPRHLARAFLLDMEGEVLRRWSMDDPGRRGFHHIEPLPDGGLVVLFRDLRIAKLDAASQVVWQRDLRVHHDVALAGDTAADGFWVATRRPRRVTRRGVELPVLEDFLTRLDGRGRVVEEIGLFDHFSDRISAGRWRDLMRWTDAQRDKGHEPLSMELRNDTPPDVFHFNAIERLTRDVPGLGEAGELVLSLRDLDLIAVFDPATRTIGWTWGPGTIERQHHPTVTAAGTLLLFDNGRRERKWSRVVEVDPQSRDIVWSYQETPRERFFSATRGAAQRLPNGNTLITESDAGRTIEVARDGTVVWELLAPLRPATADEPVRRSVIYRLHRLPSGWPSAPREPAPDGSR